MRRRELCITTWLYVANWRDGHYRGARPIKLRNGGLRWLASDADRILGGGAA